MPPGSGMDAGPSNRRPPGCDWRSGSSDGLQKGWFCRNSLCAAAYRNRICAPISADLLSFLALASASATDSGCRFEKLLTCLRAASLAGGVRVPLARKRRLMLRRCPRPLRRDRRSSEGRRPGSRLSTSAEVDCGYAAPTGSAVVDRLVRRRLPLRGGSSMSFRSAVYRFQPVVDQHLEGIVLAFADLRVLLEGLLGAANPDAPVEDVLFLGQPALD